MGAPDLAQILSPRAAAEFAAFRRITLPEEIDHMAYVGLLNTLSYAGKHLPGERVEIWCNGGGGDADHTNAIVDLIQRHSHCDGILIGTAFSAHGLIWAACSRRYVYPRAALGLHGSVAVTIDGREPTEAERRLIESSQTRNDDLMFALFASASDRDAEWWRARAPAGGMCEIVDADELCDIEMAQPMRPRVDWYGQPVVEGCEGCGKPCGIPGWIDVIVADGLWAEISGHDDGGGILCAGCIATRAALLGRFSAGHLTFE